MNKIKHWIKADEVVEPGLYMVCWGDAETYHNLDIIELNNDLIDDGGDSLSDYGKSTKFAKLEF